MEYLLEAARATACNLAGIRHCQRRPVVQTIQRQRNLGSYCGPLKVCGCSQWALMAAYLRSDQSEMSAALKTGTCSV